MTPNFEIGISVTETYTVKVESYAIYDVNLVPSSTATTHTEYHLWASDYFVLRDKALLGELCHLLKAVDKTYNLPEDWVDLNNHVNKFSLEKTKQVVELLAEYMPEISFGLTDNVSGLYKMYGSNSRKIRWQKKPLLKISEDLGREAFGHTISMVGCGDYAKRVIRYNRLSRLVSQRIMEKLPERSFTKPIDGYIADIKWVDKEMVRAASFVLGSILGYDRRYVGTFLRTFMDVQDRSYQAVENPVSLNEAIEDAFKAGQKHKSGFLVLIAEGNKYRPKDILIWHPTDCCWMSFNGSKAGILRHHLAEIREEFVANNAYWASLIDKLGVLVRPDVYNMPYEPKFVSVTIDGVIWHRYYMSQEIGLDLWKAWCEEMPVDYDPHTHTARFYDKSHDKWYSRLENIKIVKQAEESGYGAVELSPDEMEFMVDPKDFPNLYFRTPEGNLQPFTTMTATSRFIGNPVLFLNELKEIMQYAQTKDVGCKLIFREDAVRKGEFNEAEDCIITENGYFPEFLIEFPGHGPA